MTSDKLSSDWHARTAVRGCFGGGPASLSLSSDEEEAAARMAESVCGPCGPRPERCHERAVAKDRASGGENLYGIHVLYHSFSFYVKRKGVPKRNTKSVERLGDTSRDGSGI